MTAAMQCYLCHEMLALVLSKSLRAIAYIVVKNVDMNLSIIADLIEPDRHRSTKRGNLY